MISTSEKEAEQTAQTPMASFLTAPLVKQVKNAGLLRGFCPYRCFLVRSYSDPMMFIFQYPQAGSKPLQHPSVAIEAHI